MKKIKLYLIVLLLLVVCVSGYKIYEFKKESVLTNNSYLEIKEEVVKTDSSDNSKNIIDFDKLGEINNDVVGWLTLKDSIIDYPVVQSTDNEYYTTYNFNKEEESHGALFMDYMNKADLSNHHTIIYGHNKKDGTMFNTLAKYVKEKDFYNTHKELTYYTKDKTYTLKIFSIYDTMNDSTAYKLDFSGESAYESWLKEIASYSLIKTDITPKVEDKIITLSTCSFTYTDSRYVIHAIICE